MLLYIVRHAWAGQHGDPRYPDDNLRPLTDEGRKRFRRVVRKLVKRKFDPKHVATSPLVRCRQTAELVSAGTPQEPTIVELDDLAPGGRLAPLVEWTSQFDEGDVVWVGHSPDVERLIAQLIGAGVGRVRMAKGAVAAIAFEHDVAPGEGELAWLATAALLGC
jgi:phosphohistidine phosphatase